MLCEKQWYTYQYCINNTIKWSKSECALQSHIPVLDTIWFGDHGNVSLRDLQQDKRGARPVSHHILTDVTDPPFYIPCVILWKKKKKTTLPRGTPVKRDAINTHQKYLLSRT